jgi:hypothetical protein
MNLALTRKKADQLRVLPLTAVLQAAGAQPDPHDKRKWHTAQGVLSVTGTKFFNWNRSVGGGGAIDLVIHLHQLGFTQALDWLAQHFPLPSPQPDWDHSTLDLKLPTPQPAYLDRVRHYLLHHRRLPPQLIEPLIQSGSLYADSRANAVFLLRAPDNTPVGAELRGTTHHPWRGMAPGSRKDLGFFSIPSSPLPAIILTESAIDAISCFALHPLLRCISTAGARPNPRWLPALLTQDLHVFCGFDTDSTGDAMARAMISLYPSIQRLAPPQHDWNDTLRSLR